MTLPDGWIKLRGTVVRGHQVASGMSGDERFPGGTLAMQVPFFKERGLDLSGYHLATINVSIAPMQFEVLAANDCFRNVKWHPSEPAEDFSFFHCQVEAPDEGIPVNGLVYFPHPETKPEHEQPDDVLEILLEKKISGISYGSTIELLLPREGFEIKERPN